MGYESRIYVCEVHRDNKNSESKFSVYAEKICMMNLCKMDNNFVRLFTNPIDYSIFSDDGNTIFDEDKYGDHLRSASIDTVIEFLRNKINSGDNYRRLSPVLGLLEGFNPIEWGHLEVVHYGY